MTRRLLFDISTSVRWFGPPVGIVRVERELAKWAMENHPNCRFVFFDPDLQTYREVRRSHLPPLLDGAEVVDTTGMRDPTQEHPRKTDRVPRALLTPFLWITQFRRMMIGRLERLRLPYDGLPAGAIISRLQMQVGGAKYGPMLTRPDGRRRAVLPLNAIACDPLAPETGDLILFAGRNWAYSNVNYIREQKQRTGLTLIIFCHDIIPLLFPDFFRKHDVAMLHRYFDVALPTSSLVLVYSKVVARDVARFCAEHDLPLPAVQQIPPGVDLRGPQTTPVGARPPLPFARYVLMVSTIEPRKGHGLAQAIWTRLLAEGIPQRLDAGLVVVGRPGWLVGDLMKKLSATDRLLILSDVDDDRLAALYDGADFCIFPSEYEGYGLPVVEALARGRAVLASAVGVLPELEAWNLTLLPPRDEQAWYVAMRDWLLRSDRPRTVGGTPRFRHPTWPEAAAQTFAAIEHHCQS